MKHSVSHGLGKANAKKAALAALAAYGDRYAQYKPTATWTDDDRADVSFTAKGITLHGVLEIHETTIDMDLDIPFLLRPFKDRALGAVEREIARWVEKTKNGEI